MLDLPFQREPTRAERRARRKVLRYHDVLTSPFIDKVVLGSLGAFLGLGVGPALGVAPHVGLWIGFGAFYVVGLLIDLPLLLRILRQVK